MIGKLRHLARLYRHPRNRRNPRWVGALVIAGCVVALLAGCLAGNTPPTYRIGLVAPFEGRYRELGYDVIYAARLALQDALAEGAMGGYRVELVAYDDLGDPDQAVVQARALAGDPEVVAVIGHWRAETTRAALPTYQAVGLALITADGYVDAAGVGRFVLDARPETRQATLDAYLAEQDIPLSSVYDPPPGASVSEAAAQARAADADLLIGDASWGTTQFRRLTGDLAGEVWFLTSAAWPVDLPGGLVFRESLLASALYVPEPGPLAPLAYDAVRLTLEAIARAYGGGLLTRVSVSATLGGTNFEGLIGAISFDDEGFWQDAPLYLYRWEDANAPTLLARLR